MSTGIKTPRQVYEHMRLLAHAPASCDVPREGISDGYQPVAAQSMCMVPFCSPSPSAWEDLHTSSFNTHVKIPTWACCNGNAFYTTELHLPPRAALSLSPLVLLPTRPIENLDQTLVPVAEADGVGAPPQTMHAAVVASAAGVAVAVVAGGDRVLRVRAGGPACLGRLDRVQSVASLQWYCATQLVGPTLEDWSCRVC